MSMIWRKITFKENYRSQSYNIDNNKLSIL